MPKISQNQVQEPDLSLEGSQINRNGLPAGALAPDFRLPSLDGSELSLEAYRGKKVLLVFSDPNCGPCNALASHLEHWHRSNSHPQILMISKGDQEIAQAKALSYGLTFPIALQKKYEVSRKYEIFVTPVAYLLNEEGIVAEHVAVGYDAIIDLMAEKKLTMQEQIQARIQLLRQEFKAGQAELEKVEQQRTYLRETMLRISGAIQVLEELSSEQNPSYQLEDDLQEMRPQTIQTYVGNGR